MLRNKKFFGVPNLGGCKLIRLRFELSAKTSEGDAMKKEEKTKEELLEILNKGLKTVAGFERYRIAVIEQAEPGSEWSNWSAVLFEVKMPGPPIKVPPFIRDGRANQIIYEARKRYNLKQKAENRLRA
jgi:hypothetical protein